MPVVSDAPPVCDVCGLGFREGCGRVSSWGVNGYACTGGATLRTRLAAAEAPPWPPFTYCEETGLPARAAACPKHGGDACLRVFVEANRAALVAASFLSDDATRLARWKEAAAFLAAHAPAAGSLPASGSGDSAEHSDAGKAPQGTQGRD